MRQGILNKIASGVITAIIVIAVLAFIALIGAVPTYFLWNWLMPDLFELPRLTFWQAWGMFWLVSILFQGLSFGRSSNSSSSE